MLLRKSETTVFQQIDEEAIYQRTSQLAEKITEIWKPAEYFIETSDEVMRL